MKTVREETPWLDLDLTDLSAEEWRAVDGYAGARGGTYVVSNYGRVKFLGNGAGRPMRVIPQQLGGPAVVVALMSGGASKLPAVRHLVAKAFGLQKPVDHVWTHAGHVREDNRLANIISLSRSALVLRSQQRGLWTQTAAARAAGQKREQERTAKVGVYKDGVLVGQICRDCKEPRELRFFRKPQPGGEPSRVCHDCVNRRGGTLQPGNARLGRELAEKGLRRCTLCKVAQPLDAQHFRPCANPRLRWFNYVCLTCKPARWTQDRQWENKDNAPANKEQETA